MDFNLEYYRSFYYVAKYGSISKAAEALYVSQPAVSKAVQKLEEKLGCRLFQRVPHGVILTAEGQVLFDHVSTGFKELEAGERKVGRLANYETGEIKIGTTETPLYQYLIPQLTEFRRRYPKIRMDITGSISVELFEALHNGSIDLAFAVSPLPKDLGCTLYPLEEIQDVFIASTAYPELHERTFTFAELMDYPITCVSKRSSAGSYLNNYFREQEIGFNPHFHVRTSTLVLPMVRAGLSIGIVPRSVLEKNNADNSIFEIKTATHIPPRMIYMAVNEAFPMSAVSRAFISQLLDGVDRNN